MLKSIGNLYGGLVAAIIALPLAIAFGMASGLGAAAGLYGAVFLGFFAAAFGGTRTQISGPTGPMTVVVASLVPVFAENPALIFGTFLLAGAMQVAFGLLKIGSAVRFIPYPVISGFMNGIGIIIIILQINTAFGVAGSGSVLETLIDLPATIATLSVNALLLTFAALAIVLLTPNRISRVVPSPLIALVGLSLVAYFMQLDVTYVSDIPMGLPELVVPDISLTQISFMLTSALTLAILGSIDSLLTSLVADSITREKHDSNRELVGQGVGNAIASLFGGLPGAGATMRTVINIKSGATGRMSGMVHAVVLLLILLILAPLAEHIPMPVLAGILIKVGLDILDTRMLKQVNKAPYPDLAVMLAVFGLTVFVDLIVAVGVGIVLASFMIIRRLTQEAKVDIFGPEVSGASVDRITDEGIRIVNITGAFFFGSTTQIVENVEKIYSVRSAIIDCSRVPFMDLSAVYALSDTLDRLRHAGTTAYIVTDQRRKGRLLELGLGDFIEPDHILPTQESALQAARLRHKA
jgi:SulP family sulfate permease